MQALLRSSGARCWKKHMSLPQPFGEVELVVVRKINKITKTIVNFLVAPQVYKLMFKDMVSENQFKAYLMNCHLELDKIILSHIKKLGGIGDKAPCVNLIPVRSLMAGLKSMGVPSVILDNMQSLIWALPPPTLSPNQFASQGPSNPQPSPPPIFSPSSSSPLHPPLSTVSPPSQSPSTSMSFPKTLEIPTLLDHQRRQPYSLFSCTKSNELPTSLKDELEGFMQWSKNHIQLDRDTKYKACQESTLEGSKDTILNFMGYLYQFKNFSTLSLTLHLFKNPHLVASFIAYIIARRVGRGWVARHITTCKKVCAFLNTHSPWEFQEHMDQWLTRLDHQVPNLIPKASAQDLPPAEQVFTWVDMLGEKCLEAYNGDMER